MKKLDVLFSEKVALQISDINTQTKSTLSKSVIARAAMQIGLNHLNSFDITEPETDYSLDEFITIQNLKALN